MYDRADPGNGPLAGLRVIDLTRARAGPTCTRQLADMGADVICVVDPQRRLLTGSDNHNLQRNKRSMQLDLTNDQAREAFYRLAERADVVVENFRPAVKDRLGIGYDVLCARNPRLVYASISGFGQEGPYANRPGVDQIAQGLSGLMSVTGPPGSGPWRVGIAVSDTAAGTFLTQGVLAALVARERTGRGQWVHTSLLEAAINFMDFQAVRWLTDGEVPPQEGNNHPTVVPMGMFATADGHVNVAPMSRWETFAEALGAPELANDPRFADRNTRTAHRRELDEVIEQRMATATTAEWVERLNAAGCPCGPVLAVDETFADPQVEHLNIYSTVSDPDGGEIAVLRLPLTFSETSAAVGTGPVRPNHHTREILAELGYDDAEIDVLAASPD
ncbi:MAG: CoA transferase [Acidimicrobiia bacterium]|nr:CoA transferase [Acidimicrobiia bacterium]MYB72406.1 CoA transferase [Acidimicrobiia bacterium]MYI00636.1 CoA transferase [Acidimicrobiia bacterium]